MRQREFTTSVWKDIGDIMFSASAPIVVLMSSFSFNVSPTFLMLIIVLFCGAVNITYICLTQEKSSTTSRLMIPQRICDRGTPGGYGAGELPLLLLGERGEVGE